MHDLTIRGGTLVLPDGLIRADLGIEDGRIVALALDLPGAGREEIDAGGLHVFPGVLDSHVHFNEPGRADWEGFETGSRALAAGGATFFCDMPLNSDPPLTDLATFEAKRAAGEAHSLLDFGLWGGLVPDNLERLPELAGAGVMGFKAFMSDSGIAEFPAADDLTLYEGMRAARELGLPVATHAEGNVTTQRLAARIRAAGGRGVRDYLASRPVRAEVEAVQRALLYARETGASLHLVHLSSGQAVSLAAEAKASGVDVSVETCPHYLFFTEDDLERLGAALKCAPPLRPPEVRESLWRALLAGQIDLIGSDHSPAPPALKTSDDFFAVWGGISGAQSTLAALLTEGHFRRGLPLETLARLTAQGPARRFGFAGKGELKVGFDADLSLIDLGADFTLRAQDLQDRWKQNPYAGTRFRGILRRTVAGGRTVYQDGQIVGGRQARFVRPRQQI